MGRAALAAALALGACAGGGGGGTSADSEATATTGTRSPSGRAGGLPATIRVPADSPTIASALARARAGDLVLVGPGVYRESVEITTPGVVLRGSSRNEVVIDGEAKRSNGIVVAADGVSVENLTVRHHLINGVLVAGGRDDDRDGDGDEPAGGAYAPAADHQRAGFALRYVTAYGNGLYGLYAFGAQHGVIEHSYASGHPDAGIYVGRCQPCDIVVADNLAEGNAIGFEGTNAGGDLIVVRNRFLRNRVGMTVNSEGNEALAPQRGASVAGNLVAGNDNREAPATAEGGFGAGIVVAGGATNLVARNRVTGHPLAGLLVGSQATYAPLDNTLRDNVVTGNGIDIAYTPSAAAPGRRNCFTANEAARTVPVDLAQRHGCPPGEDPVSGQSLPQPPAPASGPRLVDAPAPPPQPDLPGDPGTAPAPLPRRFAGREDVAAVALPPPETGPGGTTTR